MRRAVREMGQTIVMVTHDPVAASYADRALFLADGRIVDDMADPTADLVLDRIKRLGQPDHEPPERELIAMLHLTLRGAGRQEAAAPDDGHRRDARRRLHGRHLGAHRHHLQDLRRSVRRRLRRHRRLRAWHLRARRPSSAPSGPASTPRSIDTIQHVDGVAAAEGKVSGYAQLVDSTGKPVGDPGQGAPTFGETWMTVAELNPYRIAEGHAPSRPDEIVIDRHSAKTAGIHVGDVATVLTKAGSQQFTVSGIATFGDADSMGGASAVLFDAPTAEASLPSPARSTVLLSSPPTACRNNRSDDNIAKALPTTPRC